MKSKHRIRVREPEILKIDTECGTEEYVSYENYALVLSKLKKTQEHFEEYKQRGKELREKGYQNSYERGFRRGFHCARSKEIEEHELKILGEINADWRGRAIRLWKKLLY